MAPIIYPEDRPSVYLTHLPRRKPAPAATLRRIRRASLERVYESDRCFLLQSEGHDVEFLTGRNRKTRLGPVCRMIRHHDLDPPVVVQKVSKERTPVRRRADDILFNADMNRRHEGVCWLGGGGGRGGLEWAGKVEEDVEVMGRIIERSAEDVIMCLDPEIEIAIGVKRRKRPVCKMVQNEVGKITAPVHEEEKIQEQKVQEQKVHDLPPPYSENAGCDYSGKEKEEYRQYDYSSSPPTPKTWRRKITYPKTIITALLLIFGFFHLRFTHYLYLTLSPPTSATPPSTFTWSSISPSTTLQWYPCFTSTHLCARLLVPLDYTNPLDPRRIAIAITALPPTSSSSNSTSYSGPLLLNPGGPGGSGVDMILSAGHRLHQIVGTAHTLIGFDPRGVNNTTPAVTCFPSETARRTWYWRSGGRLINSPDVEDEGLKSEWTRSKALGMVCEKSDEVGEWVGTPNVARDMLAIHEAVFAAAGRGDEGKQRGLRYWGFSYGTALGATFARLFPSRVERIVLDGAVHLGDYYTAGWLRNLDDSDAAISRFFSLCASAGPERCAFSPSTTSIAEDIEARFYRLLERVAREPIPVAGGEAADWVTADDIKTTLFWSLYSPSTRWPIFARTLASLDSEEPEEGARMMSELLHIPILPTEECVNEGDGPVWGNTGVEADSTILCSDGPIMQNAGIGKLAGHLKRLWSQSELIAGNWARIQTACVGVRMKAKGLKRPSLEGVTKTKGKILFISTELDPITPLRNARDMRTWFQGAGLTVIEGGVGHCSWSVRSKCFEQVLKKYFEDGETSEREIRCEVDGPGIFEVEGLRGLEEVKRSEGGWGIKVPGVR